MNIKQLVGLVVAGAMTGVSLLGCDSAPRPAGRKATYGSWIEYVGDRPEPAPRAAAKPAPAPAARPAPAPAPAPVATDGDWLCLPTGDRATSAICLQCRMPREVIAGSTFTYELVAANQTSTTLGNVNVFYSPEGFQIVSSDPAATAGQGGGVVFPLGDIPARSQKVVKITAKAPQVASGSIRGCLTATWTNALCCGTNVVQPALKLVKAVTPADISVCDTVTYTVTVTNAGTGPASNVKVNDNLPQGVTTVDGKTTLAFDAGTLAPGQSKPFTFQAKATRTGSFTNNAQATADNGLTAASNDVVFTARQPVLAIKKDCPQLVRLGRPAVFSITVTNNGDGPATNTVVEDTLPAGSTFVSATEGGVAQAGKVVWNLGTLAPKASKTLSLTLNVATVGSLANTVSARCTCAEVVTANCSTNIQGVPDIGTLLTDADGVVMVGDNHVLSYEVQNQGQINLTNVTVVVTLPEGIDYISTTAPRPPAVAGRKLTFTGVTGVLKPGERPTFTLTIKSTTPGEKLFISETTCTEIKTPIRDDELTNFVER